tara:strand:- start:1217 stop:1486 length:270 start_codon:yes stop_codon:yes gene_type:complete
MSEELNNKKIESVKRGLTLMGETASLAIIEDLESGNPPRDALFNHSMLTAESFGINISKSTGKLLNENELIAKHPDQTTLLDFTKGEEE